MWKVRSEVQENASDDVIQEHQAEVLGCSYYPTYTFETLGHISHNYQAAY